MTSSVLIRWIPLVPMAGAVLQATMLFFARKPAQRMWVIVLSIGPLLFSLLFAAAAFAELIELPVGLRVEFDFLWSWVGLGVGNEAFSADLAFRFDPLSAVTCLLILLVGLAVNLHGLGAMDADRRPDAGVQRFFTCMGFLISLLLVLVLAENLIMLLAAWIGTGIATASLIGFWYSDAGGERAALRSVVFSFAIDAMLVSCFVGLFWLLAMAGAHGSSLTDVEAGFPALAERIVSLPFGLEMRVQTLLALGIGLAACSRSAQLPFHFALSGIARSPAPAAAISVLTASMGIYLCCRLSFLFAVIPETSLVLAWAGALTAIVSAASALVQRDLVAILIASVVSQFGIAFVAIGCGAYSAAIYQLVITVIVFSLLILAAGSVIDYLEGERDIRRMGGLNVRLIFTHLVVVIGVASPAVFLSREQAIAAAFEVRPVPGSAVVYGLALLATLLTSWAISRFLIGVFWGSIRTPLGFRGEFSDPPHRFMLPLYTLALLSVLAVALNPAQIWGDLLPGGVEGSDSLGQFLSESFASFDHEPIESAVRWQLVAGSLLATLFGFSITYLFYLRFPRARVKLNARLAPIQRKLVGRDAGGLLERWIATPLIALSRALFERQSKLSSWRRLARKFHGRLRADPAAATPMHLASEALNTERLALPQVSVLVVLAGSLIILALMTRGG